VLFPPVCLFCNQLEQVLCKSCQSSIKVSCDPTLTGIAQSWSAGPYADPLRGAILAYKSGHQEKSLGLARVLELVLLRSKIPPSTLVPLPSSTAKVHSRGFDTIGLLVTQIARRTGLQVAPILRYDKFTREQVGLNRSQRQQNMRSAFKTSVPISGAVVLVDDVVTTGATVVWAAKSLRIAGAQKIFLISLCRT